MRISAGTHKTLNALSNGVDHFAQPRKIVVAGKRWIEILSDDDRR